MKSKTQFQLYSLEVAEEGDKVNKKDYSGNKRL